MLNISQIIKRHTELQVLGIYLNIGDSYPRLGNVLKTLKNLSNEQVPLPILVALEHRSMHTEPEYISIFPAFYSADRRASIPQVLAHSLCKDRNSVAFNDEPFKLSIFMIDSDSSDLPSVCSLAMDLAVIFLGIRWLNLWFEIPYETVSFLFTVDGYNRLI